MQAVLLKHVQGRGSGDWLLRGGQLHSCGWGQPGTCRAPARLDSIRHHYYNEVTREKRLGSAAAELGTQVVRQHPPCMAPFCCCERVIGDGRGVRVLGCARAEPAFAEGLGPNFAGSTRPRPARNAGASAEALSGCWGRSPRSLKGEDELRCCPYTGTGCCRVGPAARHCKPAIKSPPAHKIFQVLL
jgi:hypothetical protein